MVGSIMTSKDFIVNRIKQLSNKEYTPKFKVGDTIFNAKYKIASVITELVLGPTPSTFMKTFKADKDIWWYVTKDIYNPSKAKHNMKYNNSKAAYRVDMYYEKVNPNSIEILFGGK